jgi:MFS superfamily sulfate permease-like transporter
VVVIGIIATASLVGTEWALASEHRIDVGISGKGFSELFVVPDFSQMGNPQIWIVAVTLAVVASLETLLSVDAADKLDPEKRTTPNNRELIAQGVGNMASGMIGGLPVTQVIVRSSANINSGGKTKLSTMTHGVLIALAVFTISGLLNFIPYASLAAVLFMVGYKLAKPKMLIGVLKEGWVRFIPFAVSITAVVMTDLLIGVACGLGTAIVITLIQRLSISKMKKTRLVMNEQQSGDFHMELPDFTSFATKSAVRKALHEVPENRNVKIDLSNVQHLSTDVVETIDEFKAKAKSKNIGIHVIPQEQSFN